MPRKERLVMPLESALDTVLEMATMNMLDIETVHPLLRPKAEAQHVAVASFAEFVRRFKGEPA